MRKGIILLIFMSLLNSCAGIMISSMSRQQGVLTPDEIDAYNRVGYGVDGCITVSGPPPVGATTWIIHRDLDARVNFTDGCHIQ